MTPATKPKRKFTPLLHYAARGNITHAQARGGYIFAHLYARAFIAPVGSNAALWRKAMEGGMQGAANHDGSRSDPFIGSARAITLLGAIREQLGADAFALLVAVCVNETPCGRGRMDALRTALTAVADAFDG